MLVKARMALCGGKGCTPHPLLSRAQQRRTELFSLHQIPRENLEEEWATPRHMTEQHGAVKEHACARRSGEMLPTCYKKKGHEAPGSTDINDIKLFFLLFTLTNLDA